MRHASWRNVGVYTLRALLIRIAYQDHHSRPRPWSTFQGVAIICGKRGQFVSFCIGPRHDDLNVRSLSICSKSWCLPRFMAGHFSQQSFQASGDRRFWFQKGQVRHCKGLTA